jgi:hypothetical protein
METFVIRISTQTQAATLASEEELRGVVEHVDTGRRRSFTSALELLAFLHTDHRYPREEVDR